MECTIRREPPVAEPAVLDVTLILTPKEAHDLRVIATLPEEAIRAALKRGDMQHWIDGESSCQTYGVYKLLTRLAEALPRG